MKRSYDYNDEEIKLSAKYKKQAICVGVVGTILSIAAKIVLSIGFGDLLALFATSALAGLSFYRIRMVKIDDIDSADLNREIINMVLIAASMILLIINTGQRGVIIWLVMDVVFVAVHTVYVWNKK